MSLYTLFESFERVEATGSSNDKLAILKELTPEDKNLFFKFVYQIFNPYITYGVKFDSRTKKKFPFVPADEADKNAPTEEIMERYEKICEALETRTITGSAARELVMHFIEREITPFYAHYFLRFLNKEFLSRVGHGTLEKIYGRKFVPSFEIAKAEDVPPKLIAWNGKKYSERKYDGWRCIVAISHEGEVRVLSSGGNPMGPYLKTIGEALAQKGGNGRVYDGELIYENNWNLTSTVCGSETLTPQIEKLLPGTVFQVFDTLGYDEFFSQECELVIEERKALIDELLSEPIVASNGVTIRKVEYQVVDNLEDALKFNTQYLEEGLEGSILKNFGEKYAYGGKEWFKLKVFVTKDYPIVGIVLSEGDKAYDEQYKAESLKQGYDGPLASAITVLIGKDKNGQKVYANVGSMESRWRLFFAMHRDEVIGDYIEVKHQDSGDSLSTDSLRFPTFIKHRIDKGKFIEE